ncbi:uncharacterized protein LOC110840261 isoform X4 [Zootermopsis nevadensis]|uniref:uncharacterized protein LOC110840261 isoform X4 n=2 Tax=Zootermopsis nevadensis TaxID=136037 RepID=UPI000B8E2EA1|nr:uncharacterized protein LOC110840261 isoform X4 [Zootermopsis nevadensis]
MQRPEHSTDVIKHEPASDSESDTQLISMKQEGLTAFSAVKNESEDNLDSVNVMANANTASNPLIGVTENKLIDDKQHIDSFAFVTVKTEVKDEPWDYEAETHVLKDEVTTEEHELLPQGLQMEESRSDVEGSCDSQQGAVLHFQGWERV